MDDNQVTENTNAQEVPTTPDGAISQEATQPIPSVAAPGEDTPGIRNLRTAKEKLEFENRDLQARLAKIEEERKKEKYDPDELVERRYVDQQLNETKQEIYRMSSEYRLKSNYPDFEKVVNETTIAKLKEKNATIAAAIGQVPDVYSQAAAAYEAIKSMGIYQEDTYGEERDRAQENANKPRPLQSLSPQKGDSAVSQATAFGEGLTDERKKQVWKEMQHYMKQPRD